jgi:signal transduction histidine kinase
MLYIEEHDKMELRLRELNRTLETRVQEEVEQRRQKEKMLIQQSKNAAMGEMIGAIAHQWRQPLNALGLIIQDIEDAHIFGQLNKDYIEDTVKRSMGQIQFMSDTIDSFRNFFRPAKNKVQFDVKEAVGGVITMFTAQLMANFIAYRFGSLSGGTLYKDIAEVECESDTTVLSYENEFKQVVLNLMTNAKDAIIERREKGLMEEEGLIKIEFCGTPEGKVIVRVSDNGGGIPPEIIDRIFEPYYTTKEQGKGTGIGLYMAKAIVEENMGGRLRAENNADGAVFTIELDAILS